MKKKKKKKKKRKRTFFFLHRRKRKEEEKEEKERRKYFYYFFFKCLKLFCNFHCFIRFRFFSLINFSLLKTYYLCPIIARTFNICNIYTNVQTIMDGKDIIMIASVSIIIVTMYKHLWDGYYFLLLLSHNNCYTYCM